MATTPKPSVCPDSDGVRLPRMLQTLQSLLSGVLPGRIARPDRVPVVALIVSEEDRGVVADVSGREPLDLHLVESWEEACSAAHRLTAPVVLLDRDWPGTEWKSAVENLSAAPHRACVVLMSGVWDDYLRQELIRRGGYDVVTKPLRAENVSSVVKLALSYWASARGPAANGRKT